MLTKRQNLIETIKGGKPDRFVNQYEPFAIMYGTPVTAQSPMPGYGQEPVVDGWGVTRVWPEGTPGAFPMHDEEHLVLKDITKWRETVKAPKVDFPAADWNRPLPKWKRLTEKEYFATLFYAPGIFEQSHYLMSITTHL